MGPVLDLAAHQIGGKLLRHGGYVVPMIGHRESLNRQAAFDHIDPVRAGGRFVGVVIRDHSAHDDATMCVHAVVGQMLHRTTGILEIQIDAVGCRFGQLLSEIVRLVVDCPVKAKLILQPAALLITSGGADNTQALSLRNLSHQRANRSRRAGHHQGLTSFRLANFHQPLVGRQPR